MKKIVFLLLTGLAIAGCNKEKTYKSELAGSWTVYKYLLYNIDQSQQFQNQHKNDTITFTSDGHFAEFFTSNRVRVINNQLVADTTNIGPSGTYSFMNNDEMLVLDYTETDWKLVDTTYVTYPVSKEERYTIFNLTDDHVQLRTDSSQLYMTKAKKP